MIHKLGHLRDLDNIVVEDEVILKDLTEFLSVLDNEYGEDRDVDNSDGGFVFIVKQEQHLKSLKQSLTTKQYLTGREISSQKYRIAQQCISLTMNLPLFL